MEKEIHWQLLAFSELGTARLYAVLQLRTEVFVMEQNCPFQDMDGADDQAMHLLGYEVPESPSGKEVLVAYARLFPAGCKFAQASIGRVITRQSHRGLGLGHVLINEAIRSLQALWGVQPIRIAAQARLEAYYQQHGFVRQGEKYLEDGIDHLDMERALDAMPAPAAIAGAMGVCARTETTDTQTQKALQENDARWKLALDSVGDGVWDWDIPSGIEFYSDRLKAMYGYTEEELLAMMHGFKSITHPDDFAQMKRDQEAHWAGLTPMYANERRVRCKDGSWKWILSRGLLISRDADGKPLRMIGTHTDITERKASEVKVVHQANFDGLTGLPNRIQLRQRLAQALTEGERTGQAVALLFIDLDQFKEVNDSLGHDRGDLLLVQAGQRIQACLGAGDTVARMGGDEFTVILTGKSALGDLDRILQALLDTLAEAFVLTEFDQVFVSASMGVTLYPKDGRQIEELFKNADQALYVAKGTGRNRFCFFVPELRDKANSRTRMGHALRHSLAQQQFHLVYQPIVDLATGEVCKAEALLRWNQPQGNSIRPSEFIPVAESSGLIVELGEWVFQESIAQVRRWRCTLSPHFQISINKSPVQFQQRMANRASWFEQLHDLGLPGDCVTLEITEGLLMDASENVKALLLALRKAGMQVAIDDFGTGYSSLSYLQKFDIDFLKIDQCFVRDLAADSTNLALCKAIIAMAHTLGMQVTAEGIETAQQRDLLLAAGCDYGQGYLFARPMVSMEFEAWMSKRLYASAPQENAL